MLNPVREGVVQEAKDWSWSSYRAMLAPAWLPGPDWVATDKLLAYLALMQHEEKRMDWEKARQCYINHVCQGVGLPSVWEVIKGQIYLGDDKFIDKMRLLAEQNPTGPRTSMSGSRREIPNAQRRP